jgi:seryl-tRNA synthetase
MLLLDVLKADPEAVKARLARKHFADPNLVDAIIDLDTRKKQLKLNIDNLLAERNKLSRQIGDLMKLGDMNAADQVKSRVADIKHQLDELEARLNGKEKQLQESLVQLPNLPAAEVPKGRTPEDNVVVYTVPELPVLSNAALPHWELAKKYSLIDFEAGTKITGSGFPVYRGKGAVLQRALINFFLDKAIEAGYNEVMPPHMVNEESAFATGQLPDKEGQMYFINEDNLYLIPTAEVPITNLYRDVILDEKDFPVKMVGYTPCFRREAGSYGKDVRGLNRLHQFDKVEIVRIEHPDKSYAALQEMVNHVEGLLKELGLPYRILKLCGGDMGFASALTYDFEVWSAAQERWLEVSSVSNFENFQSNRLKLRFRDEDNKKTLAHTLNGSALALARIVAALLENNQCAEGIKIPAALQPYTRFEVIKT